jgi:glucose/arabinose dehydrogenase
MTTDNENKIDRYKFENGELVLDRNIINNIPRARFHNGGRIKFGPDNLLYVTTGGAQNDTLSQQKDSLAGKILRITDEGDLPENNPFENEIFSYGHRNSQGITWDDKGRLWSTEHGPSANDELNLIEAGKNYGWPDIVGNEEREGMETAKLQSSDDYTWAPTGAVFWNGSIFFTGLRGSALYEARIANGEVDNFLIHFEEDFGRMRAVRKGPEGMFYLLTNNTDGRGAPKENDDKIIKIDPQMFRK